MMVMLVHQSMFGKCETEGGKRGANFRKTFDKEHVNISL